MKAPARIAAVGPGRMGRAIAHAFAYAGHDVDLVDVKPRPPEALAGVEQAAFAEIDAILDTLVDIGAAGADDKTAIRGRIRFTGREDAGAALGRADIVFEGVPEVIDAKRETFAFVGAAARDDAIIASTTSTFLVTQLAGFVRRPERFLNAHWLNPAYLIPLVELSPGPATRADAVGRLKALLEAIGKVPVVCAASPGYIVPRIQALAMNEAARMVAEGVASAEELDKATRYGFGFRFAILGLIEFIDWGGGDILYYASRYLSKATGDARFAAPEIIDRNMKAGRIGLKTGRGFYDYSGVDVARYRKETLAKLVGLLKHLDLWKPPFRAPAGPAATAPQPQGQEGRHP